MCIGIIFEAYSPIGSPGRFMKKENEPVLLEDPVIIEIASKYNATPAQVSDNLFVFYVLCMGVDLYCFSTSFGIDCYTKIGQ